MTGLDHIRNFSIVAHIDHGKSTLADRILELTGTVSPRDMKEQLLDRMDLERERGITIKAQAVRIVYRALDGQEYQLNLIDTPGHVDFTYEVSRSLAACEGAVLLVDASQGVEAQTVANAYLALENDLEIIPVLNKIDLPAADVPEAELEMHELTGAEPDEILTVSAKTGEGVREVLEAVVGRVPPPGGDAAAAARALIFDSVYDQYRGVIAYVRVVDGQFRARQPVLLMGTGEVSEIEELGFFGPEMKPTEALATGEVGYIITGVKDVARVRVGDTVTSRRRPASERLPGYRVVHPMVFCGLFPTEGDKYDELRDALEKLSLNDAALLYEPESSKALGFGFRCGFLGLLHMDIVRERLEREYDLELLATTPNVEYHVHLTDGTTASVRNPAEMPSESFIESVEEPFVEASVLVPAEYVGTIMELCQGRRADFVDMKYLSPERVEMHYRLPLSEIVLDFFDQLKSRTKGYASLDYEVGDYRQTDLVKLDILLAGEPVDALSLIVPRDRAHARGKALVEKLRQVIPRQLFEVAVQAAIGNRVVARETVKAKRKDVLAKCYGGDITRKRKLLEKQKEGKKRMKQLGVVEVPQEAFLAVLELDAGKER
ncbi:MAG TPA: translation elongation factor 4 [Thermoleophilia bacterium]|nr:translation elongation factor 4 [Thermoleophilia bacterium]